MHDDKCITTVQIYFPQALMTVAMKFVEAGKFSLLRKCFDMVLSFAFQILYFGVSLVRAACFLSTHILAPH